MKRRDFITLLGGAATQATRVAALRNMGNPAVQNNWKEVEMAAQLLGVRAQLFDVRKSEDISLAFENAIKNQCNALLADQDALTQANKELIVSLAAKHRLPAIHPARDYAAAGGLMSFGVDYPDLYRRAATYVEPVEQPTKFELVINQKTAKALGIPVPAIMLARADEVIE